MTPAEVPVALVAKAKRALINAAIAEAPNLPVEAIAEAGAANLDLTVRLILAGALPEAKAQALNDAANDWQGGEWANAPRRANQVQERIANGQYVGDWLRDRAARLATATGEPTDD